MSSSLLITGGAGFIGANFTRYWSDRHPGDRLVVLDALTYAGHLASIADLVEAGRVTFVQGDIRDFELVAQLLREHRVDTLVHFAAESHVDRSIGDPGVFVSTNVLGTHVLLDAARQVWPSDSRRSAHRFHHVSTDEVYGSLQHGDPAFTERSAYDPSSPYAASKAGSDHLVRAYMRTFGLQCSISNCSNNYGPYQLPEKLIPVCLLAMLHGRDVPIYGKGENVRDWLHVSDHCRALEAILLAPDACETWNVGGRSESANLDLARLLCAMVDEAFAADRSLAQRYPDSPAAHGGRCEELIRFVTDRPGHDFRYAIDPAHIEARLGFRPRVDLRRGLKETVQWYLGNEDWWRSALEGVRRAAQPRSADRNAGRSH